MEHYKIRIYTRAKQDLEEIVEYLNTLSAEIAIKQYDQIIEAISSLSEMPSRCPYVRDTILRLKGYRHILINYYYKGRRLSSTSALEYFLTNR